MKNLKSEKLQLKLKMFFVVGEFTRLKQSKLCHYIFGCFLSSFKVAWIDFFSLRLICLWHDIFRFEL